MPSLTSENDPKDNIQLHYQKLLRQLPIVVTIIMIILFLLNLVKPISNVGLGLILIALFSWLLPFISQISLPGVGSVNLSGVWDELYKHGAKIREQNQIIEKQGEEIKQQQKISDELALAIYSLADNTYRHLKGIVEHKNAGIEYKFENNEQMSHDFQFLIDSGYIRWFDFVYWNDKDITNADFLTPAGSILVKLRERYTGSR